MYVCMYVFVISKQKTKKNTNNNKKKFMVKLELNLPWKPILAWPWGVKYTIDKNTYLIVIHEESWDIEPWEVRNKGLIFVTLLLKKQ